jgi:hypothetical protein
MCSRHTKQVSNGCQNRRWGKCVGSMELCGLRIAASCCQTGNVMAFVAPLGARTKPDCLPTKSPCSVKSDSKPAWPTHRSVPDRQTCCRHQRSGHADQFSSSIGNGALPPVAYGLTRPLPPHVAERLAPQNKESQNAEYPCWPCRRIYRPSFCISDGGCQRNMSELNSAAMIGTWWARPPLMAGPYGDRHNCIARWSFQIYGLILAMKHQKYARL